MGTVSRIGAVLLIATSACSSGGALPVQPGAGGVVKTGLEGTIRRGPIEPVCRVDEPCAAPVQADFALQQDDSVVTRFGSDTVGHYLVYAAPGTSRVVPDEPIGIGVQTPEVVVGDEGLTHVDLTFDTGIR